MRRPLIGITCNTLPANDWTVEYGVAAPNQAFQALAVDYLNMIQRAGGVPVVLPTMENLECAQQLWERLDGILLSGGNDLNPQMYHQRIKPQCGFIDTLRDRYEAAALTFALHKDLPVLGICRGIQMFNAVLGGSNYQDLMANGFEQHSILACSRNEASHTVQIKKDSVLNAIFQKEVIGVNSFHHQAVWKLAPSLRSLAYSEDGVIEAVEVAGHPFAVAVQWHPEMMFDDDQQHKLAQAFVRACKERWQNTQEWVEEKGCVS